MDTNTNNSLNNGESDRVDIPPNSAGSLFEAIKSEPTDTTDSKEFADGMVKSEIDAEIHRLIEQEAAEAPLILPGDETGHEPKAENEFKSESTPPKKKDPFYILGNVVSTIKAMPKKLLLIMLTIVLTLTVITAAATILLLLNSGDKADGADEAGFVISADAMNINITRNAANNSNYIYVNAIKVVGNKRLKLVKIASDSIHSAFYFDNTLAALDLDMYDIALTDNTGRKYTQDMLFSKATGSKAVLLFEALDSDIGWFSLSFRELETGGTAKFDFALEKAPELQQARFFSETREICAESDGFRLSVAGIRLSSTGSFIEYMAEWDKADGVSFGEEKPSVILSTAQGRLTPFADESNYYSPNEKLLLGRAAFYPVASLDGKINLTFDNIYKEMTIDHSINAGEITSMEENDEIVISAGAYDIVLEGFARQGSNYVLVLHTIDRGYEGENRIENNISAHIDITTRNGGVITIPGETFYGQIGADVLFDASGYMDELAGIGYYNIEITLQSARIRLKPITVSLDAGDFSATEGTEKRTIVGFIEDSFLSRLEYKSGTHGYSSISGFSSEVLRDNALMSDYKPITLEDEGASHTSIQILSSSVEGDTFHAVVYETWTGMTNENELRFSRTHIVSGTRENGGEWVITGDSVLYE